MKIIIVGATGVVGGKTLEICRLFPEKFEIVALSAHKNQEKLQKISHEFSLQNTFLTSRDLQSFLDFLRKTDFDRIVIAGLGIDIFKIVKVAIDRGKSIALATKELLVAHGEEFVQKSEEKKIPLLPIDSEISAVWQCLSGEKIQNVRRIFLTASGGPFFNAIQYPLSVFSEITPEMACAHPKWKMGSKISVDSATLMNKAFELIELVRLFHIPPEKIEVMIHPDSEIHSAVEFCDGSLKAQISILDMKIPIARALFFPEIPPKNYTPEFSFFGKKWEFFPVDSLRFPSLNWARRAIYEKKCPELLRVNDEAVEDFLNKKIRFDEIFSRIEAIF